MYLLEQMSDDATIDAAIRSRTFGVHPSQALIASKGTKYRHTEFTIRALEERGQDEVAVVDQFRASPSVLVWFHYSAPQ